VASKKITDLSAQTGVTADDLMIVVDMAGPTTYKITVANFVNSIPSNANFQANVSIAGSLVANSAALTGNVVINTGNIWTTVNGFVISKSTTPSNSTNVSTSAGVGSMWSNGTYLFVQANSTYVARVQLDVAW
jgi:hypothetical protein